MGFGKSPEHAKVSKGGYCLNGLEIKLHPSIVTR